MKRHKYPDGTEIHAGDSAYYDGNPVTVVFVADQGEYTPEYPKEDWPSIHTGFMLVFANGARLHLDEPDEHVARTREESMG